MSHQPKSNIKSQKSSDIKTNQIRRPHTNSITQSPSASNIPSMATYFEKKLVEGVYSCSNNSVYTFGSNEMGQLGKEVEVNSPFSFQPVLLSSLIPHRISSIAAGDGHTVCVSSEGVVFAWGASACGQLGLDDNESMPRDAEGYPFQPIPIPVKLMSSVKIKEVACGDAHTLAMTTEGKVFSWGGAGCGQLGHPNIQEMPKDADNCPYQPYPRIIESFKSLTMVHIACGKAHSLSIDSAGCLFTWGAGACGQLGVDDIHTLPVDDDGYPYQPVPKYLKSLKGQNIILGVCGDVHTIVLNDKGEILSFGGGSFGQLGLGSILKMPLDSDRYPYMPIPTKIEGLGEVQIVNVACGDSHSMAVDCEGRLYAWGAAACGQLGLDSLMTLPKDSEGNPYQPEPSPVTFFENVKVTYVSCGEAHTLVLCEGGIIYSFGGSSCGQLGYPEVKDSKSVSKPFTGRVNETALKYERPKLITSLLGKNVLKMSCGGVHNVVLIEGQSSISNTIFLMMKNESFVDIEIILQFNGLKIVSMKCHKYVLSCKSAYFYKKIAENLANETLVINGNFHPIIFKSIIEYMYLDDCSFISTMDVAIKMTYLDVIVDYLKLAKLFELKNLQIELEVKLRSTLFKYNEVLGNVNSSLTLFKNSNVENEEQNEDVSEQYRGLFFLPNGNAMLLMNEEIIDAVMKNSIIINYGSGIGSIGNNILTANNNSSLNSLNNFSLNSNPLQSSSKILSQKLIQMDNNNFGNFSAKMAKLNKSNTNGTKFKESDPDESVLSICPNMNKTVSYFNFSTKLLMENLSSNEDIYEVLIKFNLIDSETDINSGGYEMLKYFNKKELSDVLIKVDNKVLYGNKSILASASKYFEMMFSENMKENNNGEIIIAEYKSEEFLYLMLFLYCDCLTFDIDRALELLKGADMFAVEYLKFKLENLLSIKLEVENAAKIFKFASFYNYERLKKICLAFISDNYKKVIETHEFEDLHRESMLEIIRFCKMK